MIFDEKRSDLLSSTKLDHSGVLRLTRRSSSSELFVYESVQFYSFLFVRRMTYDYVRIDSSKVLFTTQRRLDSTSEKIMHLFVISVQI